MEKWVKTGAKTISTQYLGNLRHSNASSLLNSLSHRRIAVIHSVDENLCVEEDVMPKRLWGCCWQWCIWWHHLKDEESEEAEKVNGFPGVMQLMTFGAVTWTPTLAGLLSAVHSSWSPTTASKTDVRGSSMPGGSLVACLLSLPNGQRVWQLGQWPQIKCPRDLSMWICIVQYILPGFSVWKYFLKGLDIVVGMRPWGTGGHHFQCVSFIFVKDLSKTS